MEPRDYKNLLRQTVLLPVVLMALLAAAFIYQLNELRHANESAQRAEEVAATSRQFLRAALDMETGLRGFLLTGDRQFLGPYETGKPLAVSSLETLTRQTAGDPNSARIVSELRSRFDAWQMHAEGVLTNPPARGSRTELDEHLEVKERMDAIRQSRDALLSEIDVQRAVRFRLLRYTTHTTFEVLTVLCVFVATAIGFITHRRISALLAHYTTLLDHERQRTNEVLEAREWLLTTLRSIGEGVVSADAQGRVAFMNSVAEQITGWDRLKAIGAPLSKMFPFADLNTHGLLPDLVESARNAQAPLPTTEALLSRRDGSVVTVDESVSPIRNSDGDLAGVVLVVRDTTERHRAEAALRSSERLALLGRLSATIAHEIRNPLEAVTNLLFLIRSTTLEPHASRYLDTAEDEIRRISQTTNQLLSFNREVRAPVEIDLRQILDSVLSLFASKLSDTHITVERKYKGDTRVVGLPGELRQVFSNLVANAIDAQPRGGRILVRVSPDRDWSDSQRTGVRVIVADTGPGISDSVRSSLFTAFYTTKGEKGTGLGLWVSRGIILKHEGSMRVRTRTDGKFRGTTFSIFLPGRVHEATHRIAV